MIKSIFELNFYRDFHLCLVVQIIVADAIVVVIVIVANLGKKFDLTLLFKKDITNHCSGAPWSGVLIRHIISLMAPRVDGSNPCLSISSSFCR